MRENFSDSVAPTVYDADVKVTAKAPAPIVSVKDPLDESIVAPPDVKVVIAIDEVVFA